MMDIEKAQEVFLEIKVYYDEIRTPKYRNIDLKHFMERYDELKNLKEHMAGDLKFDRLVNAMSQIAAKHEKREKLSEDSKEGKTWSNYSERGMNKVIPAVYRNKETKFPVEWTDKWGNMCYVSNGFWGAKNYRVMDALGYMFLLKEGGDKLPENWSPIFDDLFDIVARESKLNEPVPEPLDNQTDVSTQGAGRTVYSISFTDKDFRKFTGLDTISNDILNLLLETSRVEFKLSFPVRLKSTGSKENLHRMNFFSRFFELAYEDVRVRKDGPVQQRKYRVFFSTLLGELFVNNLRARFNDRIEARFYTLPDSAQVFCRRILLSNSFTSIEIHLAKIAEAVRLKDSNPTNLISTVENSILAPLKEYGYIESFEKTDGLNGIKYVITRKTAQSLPNAT